MSARDVIAQAWAGYRAWWQYLVPLALIAYLGLGLLAVLVILLLGDLGLACSLALLVVGYTWIQGLLVRTIGDIEAGDGDLWIGTRLNRIAPCVNTLAIGTVVAGAAIAAGLLLLVVPGLVLATWWALLVPLVVLERQGVFDALRRSRSLVRGRGRAVFGALFLSGILTGLAAKVVERLSAIIPGPEVAAALLAEVVGASVVAPFAALISAVLYYELTGKSRPMLAIPRVTGVADGRALLALPSGERETD